MPAIKDEKIAAAYFEAYKENGWEDGFTWLNQVYEQAWYDGREELEAENEKLKTSLNKAKHEVENLLWNYTNDMGRGVYAFAEEALKHLTLKD